MNLQSRLILLLVGGYCLRVIYKNFIKKEGGCSECSSCSACSACKSSHKLGDGTYSANK